MQIRFFPDAKERILTDPAVGLEMREEATRLAARVQAPAHLAVSSKGGIARSGRRQAFGQVIMRGPGALAEEFGTRTHPPRAPLRRAARIPR